MAVLAVVNNRRLLLRIFIKILADGVTDVLFDGYRAHLAVMLGAAVFLQRFAGVEAVAALLTSDCLAVGSVLTNSLKKKINISKKLNFIKMNFDRYFREDV